MNDIDLPATKLAAIWCLVQYAILACLILAAGFVVITGRGPEWLVRIGAFWFLGLLFNRVMRVLWAAVVVLQQIVAVEKHARRTQR